MQHFMGHTIIVTVSTNRPGQGSRLPIYTITRGSQHDEVVPLGGGGASRRTGRGPRMDRSCDGSKPSRHEIGLRRAGTPRRH
jgi:hypothetical protein